MNARPVRMGIIGVGSIGQAHARRMVSGSSPAELVMVADANPESAVRVAGQYAVTAAECNEELLARKDIDAVVVSTPSGLHRDVTIEALDAGKHVLLEKPIEVTVERADRIIEAERRSGKLLTVASPRRFTPQNMQIKDLVDSHGFGRITSAMVESPLWRTQEYYDSAGWRGTWELDGGGALMNQGIHLVDLALWFLGEVRQVYAYTGLLGHERIEVEDTTAIAAELSSGAMMTFQATTAAYGTLPVRLAIMGTERSLVVEDSDVVRHDAVDGSDFPVTDDLDLNQQAEAQLHDFVDAIRTGRRPLVTSAQARAAVAFIEAVYVSGRTGKPVRPTEPV